MAAIAIMVGGAILNATTFVGGSYLAKYLSGDKSDSERIRHDKAIEKYQKIMLHIRKRDRISLIGTLNSGMLNTRLHKIFLIPMKL